MINYSIPQQTCEAGAGVILFKRLLKGVLLQTMNDRASAAVGESVLLQFKDSWSTIEDESLTILQKLLRIDTQNFGEDAGH